MIFLLPEIRNMCLRTCIESKTLHSGKSLLFLTCSLKPSQEFSLFYLRKYKILHFKLLCYINIFSVISEKNRAVEL